MPPEDTDSTSQQPSALPPPPQPVGINPQQASPSQYPPIDAQQNTTPTVPPAKTFPTKKLIIGIVALLIIIGLAGGGFFIHQKLTSKDSPQNKSEVNIKSSPAIANTQQTTSTSTTKIITKDSRLVINLSVKYFINRDPCQRLPDSGIKYLEITFDGSNNDYVGTLKGDYFQLKWKTADGQNGTYLGPICSFFASADYNMLKHLSNYLVFAVTAKTNGGTLIMNNGIDSITIDLGEIKDPVQK